MVEGMGGEGGGRCPTIVPSAQKVKKTKKMIYNFNFDSWQVKEFSSPVLSTSTSKLVRIQVSHPTSAICPLLLLWPLPAVNQMLASYSSVQLFFFFIFIWFHVFQFDLSTADFGTFSLPTSRLTFEMSGLFTIDWARMIYFLIHW